MQQLVLRYRFRLNLSWFLTSTMMTAIKKDTNFVEALTPPNNIPIYDNIERAICYYMYGDKMETKIRNAISNIRNPYTNEVIDSEKFIASIKYDEKSNKVLLEINPLGSDDSYNRDVNRDIIKALKIGLKIFGVKIINKVQANSADFKTSINMNTKVILVVSGKGGVGKSNVVKGIAKELQKKGKKVGIIDADIYGYSIPKLFNLYDEIEVESKMIKPLVSKEGIEIISAQYFIEGNKNEAIIWRGAMVVKLLKDFLQKVSYSPDLDYIFVDMPPGTGDIMLSIGQYLEDVNFILVTTPEEDATHVSTRAFSLAKQLGFLDLGIIENMSFVEIDNKKHYIYGDSKVDDLAKELETKTLGQVRFNYNQDDKLHDDYKKIVEKL